jgi:predicted RNase H-like nuclease (RuvC/YqgF family)
MRAARELKRVRESIQKQLADRDAQHQAAIESLHRTIQELRSKNLMLQGEVGDMADAQRSANSSLRQAQAENSRIHLLNIRLCQQITDMENGTVNAARLAEISSLQSHNARGLLK